MSGFSFDYPVWLLLIPGWLLLVSMSKRAAFRRPIRICFAVSTVLLVAGPGVLRSADELDLWVFLDRSDSARQELEPRLAELESILRDGRGPGDRLKFVDFAESALIRAEGDSAAYTGGTKRTRLTDAVRLVLPQIDAERGNRFLVVTDGLSTESVEPLASALRDAGIPLDYRLVPSVLADDPRVEGLRTAPVTLPNEPLLLEILLAGPDSVPYTVEVSKNDRIVYRHEGKFGGAREVLRLTDRLENAGSYRYTARLRTSRDRTTLNNEAEAVVSVHGSDAVLLATGYPDDPLKPMLERTGLSVRMVTSGAGLTARDLTGVSAVLLNNLPASSLSAEFLGALPFFVERQGRGLAMFGGRDSFGLGGYYGSALDPLLPVGMELREEQVKVASALAVVLDRSGSMSLSAGGGLTKMQLANDGAASAIELLGAKDAVAVLAVDSSAHRVLSLTEIGDRRDRLAHLVRSIESGGGGIYVYEGLKAGWEELRRAKGGRKHLILFSDASDSEEPGAYAELLTEMRKEQATVSVIALGSESDPDAELLRDIAKRGEGKIFFTNRPDDLRALFTQETVRVTRALFSEEPTPFIPKGGWRLAAEGDLVWPAQVDGYNLTYPRDRASIAAEGEDGLPLIALWNRGLGRTAAVPFPVGGPFSRTVREWPHLGDLVQTLARWLSGEAVPSGIFLRQTVSGDLLELELLYDDGWEPVVQQGPPRIFVEGTPPVEHIWQRVAPGSFSTTVPLPDSGPLRGVVQIGTHTLQVGPLVNPTNPEWRLDRNRLVELRQLASATGGVERVDLSTAWELPDRPQRVSLRIPMAILLLLLLLADSYRTKFGSFRVLRPRRG